MRLSEIESRPKLVKLHYFSVTDIIASEELGMRKDRNGNWFLPQYDRSGSGFDRKAVSAMRMFGRPYKTVNLD